MTAESLATVFSPNLLRSADEDIAFFFANMSAAHRATKLLITHVRPLVLVYAFKCSCDCINRLISSSMKPNQTKTSTKTQSLRRNTNISMRPFRKKTKKILSYSLPVTRHPTKTRKRNMQLFCPIHPFWTSNCLARVTFQYLCPHELPSLLSTSQPKQHTPLSQSRESRMYTMLGLMDLHSFGLSFV